ncbi:MAG: DUF2975 domain-containing protein [Bacilli bacterium]|nr:DUF2975 domain-containing protein [Bacilli bacterium]
MKEKSKKSLRVLCKILEVFTIIGKVCSIIAIPFIVLLMVCTPYFVNNINVSDKKVEIKVFDQNVVLMEEGKNDASLKVKVDDKVVSENKEDEMVKKVNDALKHVSKEKLIVSTEIGLGFLIATIVVSIMILSKAIKLFKNIRTKETPFIEENVLHLRKMAKLMVVAIVLTVISGAIINAISGYDMSNSLKEYSLFEILALFILSYIFEYGVELQKSSKKKLNETK